MRVTPIRAAVLALSILAGSCGASESTGELVLVSRHQRATEVGACTGQRLTFTCEVSSEAVEMRDGRGGTATMAASVRQLVIEGGSEQSPPPCAAPIGEGGGLTAWTAAGGGDVTVDFEEVFGPGGEVLGIEPAVPEQPWERVILPDGAELELFLEQGANIDPPGCFQGAGSWRGVAGAHEGQTGAFSYFNDTLQAVLVLEGL